MSDEQSTSTYYGHEDRLQRLEEGQSDLAVKVGEHGTRLEYLKEAVDEGFASTNKTLEKFTEHLDKSLRPIAAAVEDHGKFITAAREKQKARADRWSALKKAVLAVAIAGGGVAVKELVVAIFHALKA